MIRFYIDFFVYALIIAFMGFVAACLFLFAAWIIKAIGEKRKKEHGQSCGGYVKMNPDGIKECEDEEK